MTTFKRKLETLFVYFFTGVSIFIVVLGVSRAKGNEAFANTSSPEDKSGNDSDSQQANVLATAGSKPKVLGASESASAVGESFITPWGELATRVKIRDGKIISVDIPTLPNSPQSIYAKPILINETLKVGSANVQAVSGATITSNAFRSSLESAIARARAKNPRAVLNSKGKVAIATTKSQAFVAETNTNEPTTSQIVITETPVVTQPTTVVASSGVSGTFTGNAYSTPWGNTVASITLTNGRITNVAMPTIPNSPPSVYAEPYLVQQALSAGSANIQGVSGATVVSNAFKLSLESAIAKANAQGIVTPVVNQVLQTPPPPPPAPVPTPVIVPPIVVQPTTPAVAVAPSSVSGTFTGNAYPTKWGNTVASGTFTNGVITGVAMPQVPNSPPSIQAEPYLVQQALAAGSANIQGVSGATVVSDAFKLSLESAIAKASAQGTISASAPTTISTAPAQTTTTTTRTRRSKDNDDDD